MNYPTFKFDTASFKILGRVMLKMKLRARKRKNLTKF